MAKINPEIESFARIKVIGVGGSGTNAVNHMVNSKVRGVEFIAMNTDAQHLHQSLASKKIHIGKSTTRGLGTGMDPEVGRKSAEESQEEIVNVIKGADMVFVSCGLGGGTGTGAAPVVAKVAKDQGALTVAVVTRPFFFEGKTRASIAERGMEELKKEVDAIIVIPNDRLMTIIDKDTSFSASFAVCDDILRQAVEGLSNIITTPGIINVDFADIRAVMQNAGSALMGIGIAGGDNRATDAARAAINSPLLDLSIEGAKGVLFTVAGSSDMTMFEIQEAAKIITESIDSEAKVIFGAINDDKLKKGELKVTVIATGFPEITRGGKRSASLPEIPESIVDEIPTPPSKKNPTRIDLTNSEEVLDTPPPRSGIGSMFKPAPPPTIENEEDDWSSIPAFLRRHRK